MMKKVMLILTAAFAMLFADAQQVQTIYGYVTDPYGNPVGDVRVTSSGKFSETMTDQNGWYKLGVPVHDSVILFAHPDYHPLREKHSGLSRYDVMLKPLRETQNRIIENEAMVMDMNLPIRVASKIETGGAFYFPPTPDWNTENYATIRENGFKNVTVSPLSTFSIDVDNASYANVRRFIDQGRIPPVDAVRIEEMINYFSYDYPEPSGEHPFSVYTELAECPWNANHQLLHIGLKGMSIDKSELTASNLVFLIDVSGSMNAPDKLPLLKNAFKMLVKELRPNDRVAIVVYAGAAGQVLESTLGSEKGKILEALERLSAGGSTAGGEGIKMAYRIARENYIEGGNNRIILATDGDFNVGVSGTSEMERLVERERESGVVISVMGFGTGNIKDDKMEVIANRGNGNYSYIDNIREARKVFITEFGGTLFTIARDVKFQLEFNPQHVQAYRLVGYENRLLNAEDFNDDKKDAGEMGSGHTVTALYEIIPAGADEAIPSVDPLKYQRSGLSEHNRSNELLTIKLRYEQPDGMKSRLLEKVVLNRPVKNTSDNFRFSAAVASFGMLLRGSEHMGSTSADLVLDLANNAKGRDEEGYRAEFMQLVRMVRDLGL
ncbi:MAG: von Willebrand factor type A domain-containing protein [Bacteroidales bacterium]